MKINIDINKLITITIENYYYISSIAGDTGNDFHSTLPF